MMNGFEYEKLRNLVNANKDAFSSVRMGSPLLTEDADYADLIEAIRKTAAGKRCLSPEIARIDDGANGAGLIGVKR